VEGSLAYAEFPDDLGDRVASGKLRLRIPELADDPFR
jgi:hypothetical protein